MATASANILNESTLISIHQGSCAPQVVPNIGAVEKKSRSTYTDTVDGATYAKTKKARKDGKISSGRGEVCRLYAVPASRS